MDSQPEEFTVPVRARPDLYRVLCSTQELFNTIGDALIIVDAQGRVLFCNDMARAMFGEEVSHLELENWRTQYQYMMPDAAQPGGPDATPLLRGLRGETVTRQDMHISGANIRSVWVSVIARPHYDGGRFEWAYVILRDINLRKWSEEAMRLHDRVMTSAMDGIVIIDARKSNLPIVYINAGFERLTGYSRGEALGREFAFVLQGAPEQEAREELSREMNAERAVAVEAEMRRKDGSAFHARISITPVREATDMLTHFVAVIADITELIATQRQLRETTRMLQEANQRISWSNEYMKRNLQAAAKVQQALLPSTLPEMDGLHFAWAFRPNEELSGDILNVIQLDDDHVALYLLDVTGHGLASAMLSVAVSRLLSPVRSATALLYERDAVTGEYSVARPGKVATRLAMRFEWDAETAQFFTFVYGLINRRTREFAYACAGHPAPVCLSDAGVHILEQTIDLPIGIMQGDYTEKCVRLAPGSRLYLYSDGIIDTMNPRNELFGMTRMTDVLARMRPHPLAEGVEALMNALHAWREEGSVKDDMSLLAAEID